MQVLIRQKELKIYGYKFSTKSFRLFIVGCVYRHPKVVATSLQYLANVFRNICLRNKTVFILGDINDNLFVKDNNLGKIVRNLNLKQVIDRPTRIASHSSTLLDVAITNNVELIMNSDVIPIL